MLRVLKARPFLAQGLRLLIVWTILQVAASAWSLHRASANVGDAMLSLGAQLMRYQRARDQSPARHLLLNGVSLHTSTGTTKDSPKRVLDAFAAMCKARTGQWRKQLAHVEGALARAGSDLGLLDGVLRTGNDERGVVACFDVGPGELPFDELAARAERVVETGDFSQLGAMRYVSVEGGDSGSFFVALWSEGELNIGRAFPEQGDVPGVDFKLTPRPPASRRILSAWEDGRVEGLNVYLTKERDPERLLAFYRAELPRRGFRLYEPKRPAGSDLRDLVAEREGHMVAFSFSKTPEGEGVVTISPL